MNEMTELPESDKKCQKSDKTQHKIELARPVCKKDATNIFTTSSQNKQYIAAAEDVQNNASEFALG